jgi:hypothetical protein
VKIERLEYGDDPEVEYSEDFDSFKVYEVWSEPDVEFVDGEGLEVDELGEEEVDEHSKRLAVAVEFSMHQGGYFFIETPNPNTEWLKKVWELLQETGWQGYSFNEIRGNCRGQMG